MSRGLITTGGRARGHGRDRDCARSGWRRTTDAARAPRDSRSAHHRRGANPPDRHRGADPDRVRVRTTDACSSVAPAQATTPTRGGGVYVLRDHRARRLDGSPVRVTGLAWHDNALYVSGDETLERWSDFNGSQFQTRRTIYTAPGTFQGFNGLAFGPDGRLYVGAGVGNDDNGPTIDILRAGDPLVRCRRAVTSVSSQPGHSPAVAEWRFQRARPPHTCPTKVRTTSSAYPEPSGHASARPRRPELRLPQLRLVHVPSACANFAHPFKLLAPHTDPMGVAMLGKRVYFNEYGGREGAKVVWIPQSGGTIPQGRGGFRRPDTVGLGQHQRPPLRRQDQRPDLPLHTDALLAPAPAMLAPAAVVDEHAKRREGRVGGAVQTGAGRGQLRRYATTSSVNRSPGSSDGTPGG